MAANRMSRLIVIACVLEVLIHQSLAAYEPDKVTNLPGLKTQPTFLHYSGYLNASGDKQLHYWWVSLPFTARRLRSFDGWWSELERVSSSHASFHLSFKFDNLIMINGVLLLVLFWVLNLQLKRFRDPYPAASQTNAACWWFMFLDQRHLIEIYSIIICKCQCQLQWSFPSSKYFRKCLTFFTPDSTSSTGFN